jgi:hypothetical protein
MSRLRSLAHYAPRATCPPSHLVACWEYYVDSSRRFVGISEKLRCRGTAPSTGHSSSGCSGQREPACPIYRKWGATSDKEGRIGSEFDAGGRRDLLG